MHIGLIQAGFTDQGAPSRPGSGLPPIKNAGERVRTAFHDAITYNRRTRLGGLDASIMFELDRDENKGAAFNNSLAAIQNLVTTKSSAADLLALSLVASVMTCAGPRIPLRFGRIDAKGAGPAGVPLPTDSVEVASRAFAKAGFSQAEMTTLVACGHTLGRVHSVDFPNLVDGVASVDNNADFDTTQTKFDNLVVTEFLEGHTRNPLVTAKNSSFNSDLRIFSIANRAVVQKLGNAVTFEEQCGSLLGRMIDTVPYRVKLSDPVAIINVKPYITTLQLQKDGSIIFEGRLRFSKSVINGVEDGNLEVSLDLAAYNGSKINRLVPATRAGFQGDHTREFSWFEFRTLVDGQAGIKSFDIHVKSKSGTTKYDNGGKGGYPVNTDVLYQLSNSCLDASRNPGKLTIVTAVRRRRSKDSVSCQGAPLVRLSRLVPRPKIAIPRLQVDTLRLRRVPKQIGHYDLYRVETEVASSSWSSTFEIYGGCRSARGLLFLKELSSKKCQDIAS